jgi:sporulation protein YlmC with PRC-barrel domain
MTGMARFTIGADASCSDGVCGEVSSVVVDPVAQEVTHLVVEPKHRQGLGRLVPLRLVESTNAEVRLSCTVAEFDQLDLAEVTQFLPGSAGFADYAPGQVVSWPYYGAGASMANVSQAITYEAVPLGEVAVRRGEEVRATDGHIGRVQGLVIDPVSHHVTHVLLQEGHLWGRKEVAIHIGAVAGVDDGIQLDITKEEVEDLPSVDIDHPDQ